MTLIKSISGIRGTIGGRPGESLSPLDVVKYTASYGSWLLTESSEPTVIIGRDARPSGVLLASLVSNTLTSQGIHVIDLGLSTTPTVELAVKHLQAAGGIILTASHNPAGWNALKLLNNQGEFISEEVGKEILLRAENNEIYFTEAKRYGNYRKNEAMLEYHIDKILSLSLVDKEAIRAKNYTVLVDAVNSSGGLAVPMLLDKLGVKYSKINSEPTGIFAHNPEPLPENLTQICQEVENGQFDLGIAVDPDVDRLAFIDEKGEPFGEEYTLVAVSDYVLSQNSGNTVSNLSSTRALQDITLKHKGRYFATPVGEVNVVTKMKEVKAVIGGEGNGGVILPELHYGRDALVGIALFLTSMAKTNKHASMIRAQLPGYHISKNKIELTPDMHVDKVLEEVKKRYAKNPINLEDGVKIEFEREWVHLRKSNTEPIIRIYAESETKVTADHLANKIMMDIKEIITGE